VKRKNANTHQEQYRYNNIHDATLTMAPVAHRIVSEVCRPTRKMVSSDRFPSAVAIEPRAAFAKSQCHRTLEYPMYSAFVAACVRRVATREAS